MRSNGLFYSKPCEIMKGFLHGLLMLLVTIAGCHRDEASPTSSDLLYRKWIMTEIRYKNGQTVPVSPTSEWAIVAFQLKGTILYGDDGKYDPCCSPARFKRKGNTLDLDDVGSIPFPERTPNGLCAMASCITPASAWKIDELTATKLVINQVHLTSIYQPYP